MILVNLGSLEMPLYLLSTIGFGLAVLIDRKLKRRKYAKNWEDGLTQHPYPKVDGDS